MASNLDEFYKLTRSQRSSLNKTELLGILNSNESSSNGDIQTLSSNIEKLTKEITTLNKSFTDHKDSTDKQINELKQQVSQQNEIIAKQQKFLEQIDRKERECNVVIQGVPEGVVALDGATNDSDKIKKIWDAAGITIDAKFPRRLGKPDTTRNRPILVVVSSREQRDAVLDKAKQLKDAGDIYKAIYIKKDVHPSVRGEWKRLHDVVKTEKDRPENHGCDISLNFRERKVYKDGVVIDQWSLQGF